MSPTVIAIALLFFYVNGLFSSVSDRNLNAKLNAILAFLFFMALATIAGGMP